VALDDEGDPVGFAVASVWGRRVHLDELDMLPEHGCRGVGSALLRAVEKWARNSDYTEITLTTLRDVPWNAPLYSRIGFEAIPEEELDEELLRRLSDESALGLERSRRVAVRKSLSSLTRGHEKDAPPTLSS
jgi:ribosomal protein S18 acetylase RimI-like enzyme